jgi:adenylosuccinate synthase
LERIAEAARAPFEMLSVGPARGDVIQVQD